MSAVLLARAGTRPRPNSRVTRGHLGSAAASSPQGSIKRASVNFENP
jgi:hypothetical protein